MGLNDQPACGGPFCRNVWKLGRNFPSIRHGHDCPWDLSKGEKSTENPSEPVSRDSSTD